MKLAMKSVYAIPFIETQQIFNRVKLPDHLWRMTSTSTEHNKFLLEHKIGNITPGNQKLGLLDCWNEPIMDGIACDSGLLGLENLDFSYPTSGSAQAIGHILTHIKTHHQVTEIWVPRGDYEGYEYQAIDHGIQTKFFDIHGELPKGRWVFVSCPSSIDGNEIPEETLSKLCADNNTIVDYAYHGLTNIRTRRIPENVWSAIWSISKPYGLFYRRIGFVWVAEPVPALHSTKWFKNPEALLAAATVIKKFSPRNGSLYDKYRPKQELAVGIVGQHFANLQTSDCLLLAHAPTGPASWKRDGTTARVCLSPIMEHLIMSDTQVDSSNFSRAQIVDDILETLTN